MNKIKNYVKQEWSVHWHDFTGLAITLLLLAFVSGTSSELKELEKDESSLLVTNLVYLDKIGDEAEEDLLKLAAISATLSVIESSQVGISFFADVNVSIGEVVSEFSIIIDKSILAVMASGVASNLLIILAKVSAVFSQGLTMLFLSSIALLFVCRIALGAEANATLVVQNFAEFALIVAFFTTLALPLGINAAAVISSDITHALKQEQRTNLKNMHHALVSKQTNPGLVDRAKDAIKRFEKDVTGLGQKTEKMISFLFTYLAINLIEIVILPLFLIYGLYRGVTRLISPLFHRLQFQLGIKQS